MPRIFVTTEPVRKPDAGVMLDEHIATSDLASDHFAAQLIERIHPREHIPVPLHLFQHRGRFLQAARLRFLNQQILFEHRLENFDRRAALQLVKVAWREWWKEVAGPASVELGLLVAGVLAVGPWAMRWSWGEGVVSSVLLSGLLALVVRWYWRRAPGASRRPPRAPPA